MIWTIDPGLQGTGIAVWEPTTWTTRKRPVPPVHTETLRSGSSPAIETKMAVMTHRVKALLRDWPCKEAYIEKPAFFQSASGLMTASRQDLTKLTLCAGYIWGWLASEGVTVKFVEVHEWKGQVPKTVMAKRVNKLLRQRVNREWSEHVYDAVGIGLWVKGCLP